MSKIFYSIIFVTLFFFGASPVFAETSFTATNLNFNSATNQLSWEITDGSQPTFGIWDIYIQDSDGQPIYGGTGSNNQCPDFIHCTETFHINPEYLPSTAPFRIFIIHENSQYSQTITIPSDWLPLPTPTPTGAVAKIVSTPSSGQKTVGQPFTVDVKVDGDAGSPFNAARANVAVSSNLAVLGINTPTSNACSFQYTKSPSKADPSFAGAIYGNSATDCTVYTMTLRPKTAGTGTVTISNGSVKAYEDNSELLNGVENASFEMISGPTPTQGQVLQFSITSPQKTYATNYTLSGTKLGSITGMYVNSQSIAPEHLTETTWEQPVTLSNAYEAYAFVIYGTDGTNQTATKTIQVSKHNLGDINGDQVIDLIDASLFAIDWDKTEGLTYNLSDMNGDNTVDLTDLSILAKLQ